jgi:hypothetical protein
VDWQLLFGFAAGAVIAVITAPVGVSGAVFLLPVQMSVLGVPSPAVTPTNLLFNVISVPGALLRYRRRGTLASGLTARLLLGTLPGVVLGAIVRVFLVPDGTVFRLLVAGLLLPLGSWLVWRARPAQSPRASGRRLSDPVLVGLGFGAGLVGGVYGIVQEIEPDEDGGDLVVEIAEGIHVRIARKGLATVVKPEDDDEEDAEDVDEDGESDDDDVIDGEAEIVEDAAELSPGGVVEVNGEQVSVNPGAAEGTAPPERS